MLFRSIGVAPYGCSITSGSQSFELPRGFAGLAFDGTFGSVSVHLATKVSVDGFVFQAQLGNVNLGGITYENLALDVQIDESGSAVAFDAAWQIGNLGTSTFHADTKVDSSGLAADVSGTMADWQTNVVGTFEMNKIGRAHV